MSPTIHQPFREAKVPLHPRTGPDTLVGVDVVAPQVYLAPGTTYVQPGATLVQPGTEYVDAPIVMEGRRYYRDCWWDWGRRRCELKPWW